MEKKQTTTDTWFPGLTDFESDVTPVSAFEKGFPILSNQVWVDDETLKDEEEEEDDDEFSYIDDDMFGNEEDEEDEEDDKGIEDGDQ